jgi:hypothetical protein
MDSIFVKNEKVFICKCICVYYRDKNAIKFHINTKNVSNAILDNPNFSRYISVIIVVLLVWYFLLKFLPRNKSIIIPCVTKYIIYS